MKDSFLLFLFKILPNYGREPAAEPTALALEVKEKFIYGKIKPGRDYFTGNFFSLVVLFIYDLLCHKNMTELTVRNDMIKLSSVLNHFSTTQVLILAGLLVMMQIERMLYRIRNYAQDHESNDEMWCHSANIRKHILSIKLAIYTVMVVAVHIVVAFTLPLG